MLANVRTRWTAALALAALTLSGCAGAPGMLVVQQSPHQSPQVVTLSTDGRYGLFMTGASDPLIQFDLKAGDKLGFQQQDTGTVGSLQIIYLAAVAGDHVFRLDVTRGYQWRKIG